MRILGGLLLFLAGCCLPETLRSAPIPPCPTATLAVYEALPNGCIIGPSPTFTFSDFAFQSSIGPIGPVLADASPNALLTAADILVTPSSSQGALALSFSSTGFSVATGQSAQYSLSYLIDPPPPEIIHFALRMVTDPPVYPGLAQITSDLCIYAQFSGTVCPSPGVQQSITVFDNGVSSTLNATTPGFSPPAIVLSVDNVITLNASSGGQASFSSFANTTSTIVPEPLNAGLLACGLALVLLLALRVQPERR